MGGSVSLPLLPLFDRGLELPDPLVEVLVGGLLPRRTGLFVRLLCLCDKRIGVALLSLYDRCLSMCHGFCKMLTLPVSHSRERDKHRSTTSGQELVLSHTGSSLPD